MSQINVPLKKQLVSALKKIAFFVLLFSCAHSYAQSFVAADPENLMENKISQQAGKEKQGTCEIKYENGVVAARVYKNEKGSVIKTIKYYGAEGLNTFIASRIAETYGKTTIYSVTEMSSAEGIAYYIILQDDKKWYHVVADPAGSLTLYDKFRKI